MLSTPQYLMKTKKPQPPLHLYNTTALKKKSLITGNYGNYKGDLTRSKKKREVCTKGTFELNMSDSVVFIKLLYQSFFAGHYKIWFLFHLL